MSDWRGQPVFEGYDAYRDRIERELTEAFDAQDFSIARDPWSRYGPEPLGTEETRVLSN